MVNSRPGDLDTNPGQESQEILEKTVRWTEEMYSWSEKEIQEYIEANESNQIAYIEYDYHQIGKTEEWFRKVAAKISNPLTVRREILLQRLRGSDNSPYPREDIDAIIEMEKKPLGHFYLQKYYPMYYYEELDRTIPYLVGIDCSTGTLKDNNAMTVINPYTLQVAAEFECSYIGESSYFEAMKELVLKHIPKAIMCIERNHVGDAILDFLLKSPIAGNMYYDRNKDLVAQMMNDNEDRTSILKRKAAEKPYYGVYTEGNSRERMFNILANHVTNHKESFVGHNVTRDLSRLVLKPSGRVEAGGKFHDDSIMSFLIALYIYYHGNNLALFGFRKGEREIENQNQGIDIPLDKIEVDALDLPQEVKTLVKSQQEKEKNTENYEDMMRRAVYASQQETIKLQQSSLAYTSVYETTPEDVLEDTSPGNMGSIPLSFFDEINM